jgi:hypothetical protein
MIMLPIKTTFIFMLITGVLLLTCEHHNPFNPDSPDYDPPRVTINSVNTGGEPDSTASETIIMYISGNRPEVDIRYGIDSVWSKWAKDFKGDSIIIADLTTGKHIITLQGRYDDAGDTHDTSFTIFKVDAPYFIHDSTSLLADSLIQIRAGENCTLTVHPDGTQPFTLVWYRDTMLIDSTDAEILIITNFAESDSGLYYCIAKGRWGEAVSDSVILKYLPPVNHQPEALPDSFTVNEDDTLTVKNDRSILKNDTDADNDSLKVILADSTHDGTITLLSNGAFTYTPAADFSGKDSFIYKAVDHYGAESEPVSVQITVEAVNDLPILINNNDLTVSEGGSVTVDTQHLFVTDIESGTDELIFTLTLAPRNGLVFRADSILTENATFTQEDINGKIITYRHNGSETTSDTFFLSVSDGDKGAIDSVEVLCIVAPVNDTPYIASKLDVGVTEGGIKAITSATLIVRDNDNTPDELTFTLIAAPLYGSITLTGLTLEAGDSFTQQDIDSGRISYRHDKSINVTRDSLSFTVHDTGGAAIEKTSLIIRIGTIDDPPAAIDQQVSTNEDTPLSITLSANDPEGAGVSGWEISRQPEHGTLTGAGGTRVYTPEQDFFGADTFMFRANDGVNWSDTGIIAITVLPVNDAPVWKHGTIELSVKEGTLLQIDLDTLFDKDPEGDQVTFSKKTGVGIITGSSWSWSPGFFAATDSPANCTITSRDNGSPAQSSDIILNITVNDSLCKLTVFVTTGTGTIQVQPNETHFDPGTEVKVTAVPGSEYVFKNWTGDISGADSGSATITATMNSDKNISAKFVQISETVTLNIGESYVHGSLYTNGYYFLSTRTTPAKLLRINADNLSAYDEITFSEGHEFADQITYVKSLNKLYIVFGDKLRTAIAEVDPITMEFNEDAIVDSLHGTSPLFLTSGGQSICNDDDFLYVVTCRIDTSRILKYSLTTMSSTPVAVLNFPQGNQLAHAIRYENGYLYVSNGSGSPWVARVNASSLEIDEIQGYDGTAFTDDFTIHGNYLFLGIEADYTNNRSGQILRVDKNDLTSFYHFSTGIKGGPDSGNGFNYSVQEFGGNIWTTFATSPGIITRINPVSLEYQNYSLPYNFPNEIIPDGSRRILITYWDQDPGKIQAFDPVYLIGREIE